MNPPTQAAFALAGLLLVLGVVSGYVQVRGLRALAARKHVPSDEHAYLRNRYRRRLLIAGILVLVAGLIAGSYAFGFEQRVDQITAAKNAAKEKGEDVGEDDKFVLKVWGGYWVVVISLVFVLVALAVIDAWATRRYWHKIFREMRDEHHSKLRRDLAVYRQQKESRSGRFGRGASGPPVDPNDTPNPD